MKKIIAYANYSFIGAHREKIMEFNDDTTDEEIDKEIWEWATSYISLDKEEIKGD